jgi:hypothetical protein
MKHAYTLLLFMLMMGALCAEERPAAQITFKVTDDFGRPVTGATIGMSTFHHWQPGEGFGKDISETFTGVTDEKGLVTLSGNSLTGDFSYGPREKGGYYRGGGGSFQFKERKEGRWEPWNPAVEIVMKRVVNPIPMYARRMGQMPKAMELPAKNKSIGFDLMRGDWIAPYGTGSTADLTFALTEEVPFVGADKPFASMLTVTFSNPLDGIRSVLAPLNGASALRLPRFAPEDGYVSKLEKRFGRPAEDKTLDTGVREDQNYFIRVRTVTDENHKIKSAYYGKIIGDISCDVINSKTGYIQFTYCLNPTSLDRNMEFDPNRNLFGNLPSSQRVSTP